MVNPLDDLVTCSRCGRITSQIDDDFLEWEALPPDGSAVVCPGCLSGEEEQSLVDDLP